MNLQDYLPTGFNGAVSIRKHGKLVAQKAFGYADLANKVPNKLHTRFQTGSASKTFTAVAIMQLVEMALLTIDTSLNQIFDFDLGEINSDVTVRDLLTHTSGIPDYYDESESKTYADLWKDKPNYSVRGADDILPLFLSKPMQFEPGEKFKFNHAGYVLLGMIIEKVTGLPFDDYLRQAVFQPAGMNETGYFELDRLPADCACAYIPADIARTSYYSNIYSVDVKGSGAGGAFTTVLDMDRFWDALLRHKLLKPYITSQMLGLQAKGENGADYGYGIWLKTSPTAKLAPYLFAQDPGINFISEYDPESEILATIISNTSNDVKAVLDDLLADSTNW